MERSRRKKTKKNISVSTIILILLICIPYLGLAYVYGWYKKKTEKIENSKFVIISKHEMQLYVYDYKGKQLSSFPIACGENYGQKGIVGDRKTPEGVFRVSQIQNSSSWSHDFNDGKGEIQGAYGPWFIRLDTPGHKGIGIHGTHDPYSLNTRSTEGCIRISNENVSKLAKMVKRNTVVVITPSGSDIDSTIVSIPLPVKSNGILLPGK